MQRRKTQVYHWLKSHYSQQKKKQRLLVELVAATSMKEFKQVIKTKSTTSKTDNSKEDSSQFDPYDMFG